MYVIIHPYLDMVELTIFSAGICKVKHLCVTACQPFLGLYVNHARSQRSKEPHLRVWRKAGHR